LSDIKELWQQPSNLLHKFKQSYYIKLSDNKDRVIKKIRSRLDKHNINATIIYSIDTRRKIGLIDIIPPNASKVNALNYVLRKLKVKKNDVLYCGDSGNDISVLTSGYRSVLVKNAAFSVKDEVLRLAEQKRLLNRVYLAQGNFVEPSKRLKLNGNYVSGIIEGAYHFGFFK
jgi:hydroxymethylpyrimidine pyrophosphatase-like HAD family hydrolase